MQKVGVASSMVAWYCATSAPTALASRGSGDRRRAKPVSSGNQMVTVKPKEWKNGRTPAIQSRLREREKLVDGVHVGDDVLVREHHALGPAGAAARENHRRQAAGVQPRRVAEDLQESGRQQARFRRRQQHLALWSTAPAGLRGTPAPGAGSNFSLLKKTAGGQDRPDPALLDRRGDRFPARREVQVHRALCPPSAPRCWPARLPPKRGA